MAEQFWRFVIIVVLDEKQRLIQRNTFCFSGDINYVLVLLIVRILRVYRLGHIRRPSMLCVLPYVFVREI